MRIPVEELSHTLDLLQEIRERIDNTAGLDHVGSEEDVGDPKLASAIAAFDSAWRGGQERVQENVDTFRDATEGIIEAFESTDNEAAAALEGDGT